MKFDIKLDNKDRKIIGLLNDNPGISQDEIAEQIHLSQPSVAMRIKKLKDKGFIEQIIGINPHKVGLHIAKIDIATNNPTRFLNMYRNCPYFLNGFTVSGSNNLSLMFIGETIASLESKVDTHLRADKYAKNVEFNIIISSIKDFVVPIKVNVESTDKPPCGTDCDCIECPSFKDNKCFGCPIKNHNKGSYKGLFWKS